jgi:Fe-S protein assembly chaperone HscA
MANVTFGRFDEPEIIVGIDLGTTNSLVAITEKGVPRVLKSLEGNTIVPSIIHWDEKEEKLVAGVEAKHSRITDARHTAYSVKRFMGRGKSDLKNIDQGAVDISDSTDKNILIKLGNRSFSAIELSSEILKVLKNVAEVSLNSQVSKAVITVPAYFNDSQRSATRLAGTLAGLDVVRIVNEPTAAALAYGLDKKRNGLIAVYDLGGGTFDISLLKLHDGIFEVLATNGDTALGGDDFDNAIVEFISNQLPKDLDLTDIQLKSNLIEVAEKLKIILTEKEEASAEISFKNKKYNVKITRLDFTSLISDLVKKTVSITQAALDDAELKTKDIGDIVMVGGSTRIPYVRQILRDFFGKDLNISMNPEEVVALGAAVQADILSGSNQDMVLLDVVPLSLGIETYGGTVGKIIHRNTKIPAMAQETFTTHVDGQKNVLIHVLQGERELATDCRSLGRFDLKGLPPMPAGLPKIQVVFLIDANGILKVGAKELTTNTEAVIEVKPTYGLTDNQVEQMLNSSFENAEKDLKARQLIDTRVEAEGILRSAEKILKEGEDLKIQGGVQQIRKEIENVKSRIKGDDHIAIKDALEVLEEAAKPLAALVMNQALQAKLGQKNVKDILDLKKENS